MTHKMSRFVPPFMNAMKYKQRIGIIDGFGKHSYNDLYNQSRVLSKSILRLSKVDKDNLNNHPMKGERVAFLCSNDHTYVTAQWGAWMTGSTAVPLSKYHPQKEMEFVIEDCSPKVVVCTEKHADLIHKISDNLGISFLVFSPLLEGNNQVDYINRLKQKLPDMYVSDEQLISSWNQIHWEETNAQIIYTSGTTGRPKGVVTTFTNICSQVEDLNHAWNVTCEDGYLHVLPLHHLHGIVNNLISPLSVGACVTMLPDFTAEKVWHQLLENPDVNVFHAVPTIYSKLIEFYQDNLMDKAEHIRKLLSTKFRLMVSGSAALPVPTLKKWEEISGHVLLERYGMTEIGMALTNPLHGKRVEGAVGKPFPSFKFKIEADDKRVLAEGDHKEIVKYEEGDGALLVKGDSVFKEYLNLHEATKESFDENGWFITGDTAVYDIEHDVIRIMGRTSVDIINSAGYKMSALEIEKHLLSIKGIKEAVVVALPDEVYEEIVCAVVVPAKKNVITLKFIQEQCKDKMARYKIPRELRIFDEIPKNPMGKVNKKDLVKFILNS